jgi:hypothetical protein
MSTQESDALHARVQAFIRARTSGILCNDSYESIALSIARFQATHIHGYARLCRAHGIEEGGAASASAFPAVPTDAFKITRVSAFAPKETPVAFRTSGTTAGSRGTHWFRHTKSYDMGALAFGALHLRFTTGGRFPVLVVGPHPHELPDSSLTHMLSLFVDAWGTLPREAAFFIRGEKLETARLAEVVKTIDQPALVCGTSFAFVHLLDQLGAQRIALPQGSRIMQTGGFKGRARSVDAAELKRLLARAFGLDVTAITSEYGMTELSSQFYEVGTSAHGCPVYAEPPWARVIPVDPVTLLPVAPGEEGIARIEDLANVDSAWALIVADRVRTVRGGFELLGRLQAAAPRGCSIAIDEILGGDG